jgi:NAD(P)-dependent dehydrogenase (short-subunit alcohol dehydrogenase family)
MKDLTGKVAIVTGSSSGIGRASAAALAAAGCRIVVHGREPDDVEHVADQFTAEGFDAVYVGADLTSPASAAKLLADAARSRWGRIDILVNNAAAIMHRPIAALSERDWASVYAVNVHAPFFLVQECVPDLTLTRGCVIMISSTNAIQVNRNNLVYDSSKAALNHLAQGLALELREAGIRVNTLMPGGTETPSVLQWARDFAGDEAGARELIARSARDGKLATPSQIAEGVLMLASGQADWITGAVIAIDGGHRLGD